MRSNILTFTLKKIDYKSALLGIAFVIMWSSAFTSAKVLVQYSPPLFILAIRFLISGSIGILLAYLMGQRINFSKNEWKVIIIFGICQNSIYLGLNFIAMKWVDAGIGAVIASTLPIMVATFSIIMRIENLNILRLFGLCIGFSGVLLIMIQRIEDPTSILGLFFCSVGAIALAIATIVVNKTATKGENILMIVGLQMLIGSLTLFPFALIIEDWFLKPTLPFFISFCYTTIFPGLVATVIWLKLVGRIGATQASSYHFLNPFFGVVTAAALLSENLTLFDYSAVIIITLGIVIIQRQTKH